MHLRLSRKALLNAALLLSLAQLPSGCAKGISGPKTVPTADFSATPRSGAEPLAVTFTDRSSPGSTAITSVLWNFGDNQSSTERNPQHTYAAPGNYTISLEVTNSDGSDIGTKADYITVGNGALPTAAFTATPTSGPPGMTVQFTDESTPGTSPITSWSWTFGDGGTSTSQSPNHAYAATGSYTVSLTVTSAVGPDVETKTDYILVAPSQPIADFSANPTSGTTPFTVTFTDHSVSEGTPIISWAWDFGDGGVSTLQNPNHIYLVGGTYTVSLTVTNSRGSDTATKSDLIVATQGPVPPAAQFSGTPRSGNAPLTVQFTDQSSPGTLSITNRLWAFGDGATSTATNPTYIYTNPGRYTVTLTVGSAVGDGREEKAAYIQVTAPPVAPTANFSGSPTSGMFPLAVQFTDLSLSGGAPITSWRWDFGDGGGSTAQNPSHTYLLPGTYHVSLTATNSVGPGSLTKTNYITASILPVPPATTTAP
jgi:PKD repeat protein